MKGIRMNDTIRDKQIIRDLIEQWVLWRDTRMWDKFRSVWHDDGQIWATWFQGTADEFIRISEDGYRRGVRILHTLGGMAIDIADTRAIAQTKMTIHQRASVDRVLCDVTCRGRFYDFIEKRPVANGHDGWGIVLRRGVFDQDRIDVVEPGAKLQLDKELLAQFPEGYRHLAYLQTRVGLTVNRSRPGLDGPELEALYAKGADWLAGKTI